jgi:ABC-type Fe3+/spermidine/putrescine transport system ATPase subunit
MIDVLSELTPTQQTAIEAEQSSFLLGSAGSGKTTALQHRLLRGLA